MSAASIDKEKVYRPVTGSEAIDLILTEFHRQLVNSGLFPLHRTWHEFEIAGGVRVKGWSTHTEDVKFKVELRQAPACDEAEAEERRAWHRIDVSESVAVHLGPGPPDKLRETLSEFPCGKGCGRILYSKAGKLSHERHCKAELPPAAVPIMIDSSETIHTANENPEPNPTAPAAPLSSSN